MGLVISSDRSQIISELQQMTKMSQEELEMSYDKFMRDNPSGGITREHFIEMFEQSSVGHSQNCRTLFERLFDVCDSDGNGTIDVKEYLVLFSVATKGTLTEKLSQAFTMFDIDNDNFITREEAQKIFEALYEMDGSSQAEEKAKETTDDLFGKLDRNDDGLLSREEFLTLAKNYRR